MSFVTKECNRGELRLKLLYEYTANQYGKAYLLTYTAGQDTFDQYLKVAEGILQSFQFTPATDGRE
ncbi:MAG: hypothetical protein AAFZ63_27285 [Bacteroidota bacterium]